MVPVCVSLVAGQRPEDYKRNDGRGSGRHRGLGGPGRAASSPAPPSLPHGRANALPGAPTLFMPCSQFAALSAPNPSLISSLLASTPSKRHDDRPERAPGQARHCQSRAPALLQLRGAWGTHLPHPMPLATAAGC
jgi:hypothetical protein